MSTRGPTPRVTSGRARGSPVVALALVALVGAGVTAVWVASGGSIPGVGPAATGATEVHAASAEVTGVAIASVALPGTPPALYAAASSTCAAMPIRATGRTHYFCDCQEGAQAGCVAGNDANAGASRAVPKQSWSQVVGAFNAMNAGDTVALCKGGAWSTSAVTNFVNSRCGAATNMRTAANKKTCDLRDYAPPWGGTARPIIRQTTRNNLFNFANATLVGVRVLNLDLEGSGTGPPGDADVGQRAIHLSTNSDFLICNNTFNGWFLGIHQHPYSSPVPARIDIWGNRFTHNSLDAYLGGGPNTILDANFLDTNGAYNPTTHAVYLQGRPSTNVSVVNNEMRYSEQAHPCAAVVLVAHDELDGLNIENNVIDGGTDSRRCWGISLGPGGYGYPEFFRNVTIRRNMITNSGWSGISLSAAPNAVVENNVIVTTGTLPGSMGIQVPQGAGGANGSDVTTGVVLRNNTIFVSSRTPNARPIMVPGERFAVGEGAGYVIANNSVHMANRGTCFSTTMAAGAYAFVGNNACYGGTWGTTFDGTSHVTADPLFANAPTDFAPRVGSPLLGRGSATWAPTHDFALRRRPSPPSIGALELPTQ